MSDEQDPGVCLGILGDALQYGDEALSGAMMMLGAEDRRRLRAALDEADREAPTDPGAQARQWPARRTGIRRRSGLATRPASGGIEHLAAASRMPETCLRCQAWDIQSSLHRPPACGNARPGSVVTLQVTLDGPLPTDQLPSASSLAT
jgi:hypothetical protein